MLQKNGWSSGSHHTKPPPSQNGGFFRKLFFESSLLLIGIGIYCKYVPLNSSDDLYLLLFLIPTELMLSFSICQDWRAGCRTVVRTSTGSRGSCDTQVQWLAYLAYVSSWQLQLRNTTAANQSNSSCSPRTDGQGLLREKSQSSCGLGSNFSWRVTNLKNL